VEYNVSYKAKEKLRERRHRIMIKDKGYEHAVQVVNDAKRWEERKKNARREVLNLLGVEESKYEATIRKMGNPYEIEYELYKHYLEKLAKTDDGVAIIKKADKISKEYVRKLNLELGWFAMNEDIKGEVAKESLDNKVLSYIPRMVALDDMHEEYRLDDTGLDIIIEVSDSTSLTTQ